MYREMSNRGTQVGVPGPATIEIKLRLHIGQHENTLVHTSIRDGEIIIHGSLPNEACLFQLPGKR